MYLRKVFFNLGKAIHYFAVGFLGYFKFSRNVFLQVLPADANLLPKYRKVKPGKFLKNRFYFFVVCHTTNVVNNNDICKLIYIVLKFPELRFYFVGKTERKLLDKKTLVAENNFVVVIVLNNFRF